MRHALLVICIISALSYPFALSAQKKVIIKGEFQNIPAKEITLRSAAKSFFYNYLKLGSVNATLNNNQFVIELTVEKPVIKYLYVETDSQYYGHPIFIAPGYNLHLVLSVNEQNKLTITSTGIGKNDNQALLIPDDMDLSHFLKRKDSLPHELYQFISQQSSIDSTNLSAYIKKHNPSAAFKEAWHLNIQYSTLRNFHNFSENWKFSIGESYYRNIIHWDNIKNDLIRKNPLQNEKALDYDVPNYASFINFFVGRKKEQLWRESWNNKKAFIAEWYNKDYEAGLAAYNEDPENILHQKIIDRYFTGACREYLYVLIFDKALRTSNPNNLERIYNRMLQQYPKTSYKKTLDPALQSVFKKMTTVFNPNMIFIERSDTLTNFEQVLKYVKGETVLLDMWGTWCAPCREEFDKNLPALKAHFNKKGLKYLYIANGDQGNNQKWKDLIRYFKLEGYHIIANQQLTDDIMKKTKGSGYPTYVIIKRDGSYEKYRAGYPISREQLIKQLEEALK